MPPIAVPLMVAAAAVSAAGSIQQGRAAASMGRFQNAQLDQQAGQVQATSQRQAAGAELQGTLAASKATAMAGASGLNPDSTSFVNDIAGINEQSHINALADLYNGNEKATGMQLQGQADVVQGNEAEKAGYIKAASGILGAAGSSMMMKYSPTGGPFDANSGVGSGVNWNNPGGYGSGANWMGN